MSLFSWYWRSHPLNHRTGSDIFNALFRSAHPIATLLESPFPALTDQPNLCRYSICAGNPRQIDGKQQLWTPAVGQILPCLEERLQQAQNQINSPAIPTHLPFTGGWLGWLGYDLAWEIEQLPQKNSDPLPFPVAYWYEPESFAVLDHQEQILWLATSEPEQLEQLEAKLQTTPLPPLLNFPSTPSALQFITNQTRYEESVKRAKDYIQAGDIFQTNLSLRFQTHTTASSWQIYQTLHHINPSPFASYWQTPWGAMISCSPERLISRQASHVETRPIAGTRSRGETPDLDLQLEQDLRGNLKEQAEHIMLVDLERNDLGKVCQWGTVEVDELLTVERYSHVMHLVSNVRGKLDSRYDSVDLIRGVFPGGTITGCPKVRCMEIIEELEPVRRNLFYGSCGYLDQRGNLDLNILIRTLLMAPRQDSQLSTVWGQVGAGIVADSDPHQEWIESLHKAQAQLRALSICE